MIDWEKHKEHFARHVATLMKHGPVTVLDFKEPGSVHYHVRYTFDESQDPPLLLISGDLGHLVARNHNMRYTLFGQCFVGHPDYFGEKVLCMERPRFCYSEEKAKADLLEIAYHYGIETREDLEEKWPGIFEEHWGDLARHLDVDTGLDASFVKRFAEEICDDESEAYYQLSEAGKTETGILDLYLNAFVLACEQVK